MSLFFEYQAVVVPGAVTLVELPLTTEQVQRHRGAKPVRLWFWRSSDLVVGRHMVAPYNDFEILGIECDGRRVMIGPAHVRREDRGCSWAIDWPALDQEAPKFILRSRVVVGVIIELELELPVRAGGLEPPTSRISDERSDH